MLKARTTSFYLDYSEYSLLVARTRVQDGAIVVEELGEFSTAAALLGEQRLRELLQLKKSQYAVGCCGVSPAGRFVRRKALNGPTRGKSSDYLADYIQRELGLDPALHMIAALNAETGEEFDAAGGGFQREVVFCGAPESEILQIQTELVEAMLYPSSLEISMLAAAGGLMDYIREMAVGLPVLYADIGLNASHAIVVNAEQLCAARSIASGIQQMIALVQQEYGYEDAASAQAMLYSDSFDWMDRAPHLLKRLFHELEAAVGQYEVQTGQVVGGLFVGVLPVGLGWVAPALARALQIELLSVDYQRWLSRLKIVSGDHVDFSRLSSRWFRLFSLMGDFTPSQSDETSRRR